MFQARICGGKNAFYEHTPFFAHPRRYHNLFDLHFIQLALLHLKFVALLLSAELFLQTVVGSAQIRRPNTQKHTGEDASTNAKTHRSTDTHTYKDMKTQTSRRKLSQRGNRHETDPGVADEDRIHTYLDIDVTSTCIK